MFAPACSTQTMGCTSVNNSDPNTTKRRSDRLRLDGAASFVIERELQVTDTLDLEETHTDFFDELLSQLLVLADNATRLIHRIGIASSTISLSQQPTLAGQLGGGGGGEVEPVEAIFNSNTAAGMAVYVSASGHVDLALGDIFNTKGVVGFALENVLEDAQGQYTTMGVLTLDSWANAIEGIGDLIPGALYYLSVTDPGKITPVATTTPGTYRTIVGRALTEFTLAIEIGQSLLI